MLSCSVGEMLLFCPSKDISDGSGLKGQAMIGHVREAHVRRSWTRVTFRRTLEQEPPGGPINMIFWKIRETHSSQRPILTSNYKSVRT